MVGVTLWQLNTAVAGVSVVLLVGLLYVYARNLREVRTPFGLGLLVFALLFLVENAFTLVAMQWWSTLSYGQEVALPLLLINLAEVAGFGVLLAISWS